ncbi:MAG: DegV family protein [Clostridia bacterium]|nr:DegV family protein [Clostridia bacterium]
MSVKIIIDSTADVTPEIKAQLKTVHLTVHFGNEEFIDGVTIDHQRFYEKLIESDTMPHTSQATPADFASAIEEVTKNGDSAVIITLSSKLSGTYQSAMIAAAEYENVYVVDSGTVTIGAGILAEYALQLSLSGMSAKEIAENLEKEKENILIIAMVDTLEYLKRGGRVSKTVAFAGGLLNIKPVIAVKNGEILMLGKARGSKQGNNLLVTEIEKAGGVNFDKPLLLGYTGLSDVLLEKYIEDSEHIWKEAGKPRTTVVGSVIGAHAGPGAIAAAFFKK